MSISFPTIFLGTQTAMKGESGGNATSLASMMLFLLAAFHWEVHNPWRAFQTLKQLPNVQPNTCYETNPLQAPNNPSHQKKNTHTKNRCPLDVTSYCNSHTSVEVLTQSDDTNKTCQKKKKRQKTPFKMSEVSSKTSWKWFTTSLKKWKVVKELKNPFGVMIDLHASLFAMDGCPFSMRVANPTSKVPSRSKVLAMLFGLRVKNFVFVAH